MFFLLFAVCIITRIVFVIPTGGASVYAVRTLSWIEADGCRVVWGAYLGHSPEVVEVAANASLGNKVFVVAQECLCVASLSTGEGRRAYTDDGKAIIGCMRLHLNWK